MPSPFQALYESKLDVMQALAKSLNVFLDLHSVAFDGHSELSENLEFIKGRLPPAFKGPGQKLPIYYFLLSQNFVSLISEFETFLVDVMAVVIRRHPLKAGAESFKLSEVLEAGDAKELTRIAAERYANGIMYKRASEYRKCLAELLSAGDSFLKDKWPLYVERKARRDIGVHNGWKINDTYRRKLAEVGMKCPEVEYAIPENEYFWETLGLLSGLMHDICIHCVGKFTDVHADA